MTRMEDEEQLKQSVPLALEADQLAADEQVEEEEEDEMPVGYMWLEGDSLAPPCQSDRDVVQQILKLANLSADDLVMDLGCGDGRICVEAARRFHCKARGVEIEPFLIEKFHKSIENHQLQALVSVCHEDLMTSDLSQASVIVTYLLPEALGQLEPKLKQFLAQKDRKRRVICNTWGMPGLEPVARVDVGPFANVPLLLYTAESLPAEQQHA